MRRACRLGNHDNFLCLGHGLHNLVYTDGIKKTDDVSAVMKKVRNIVKALRYKTGDFHKISEDEQSRFEEFSDDEDEDESDDDSDDEILTNDLLKIKSLKLDVVTRWYSLLFMLESLFSRGRASINEALRK